MSYTDQQVADFITARSQRLFGYKKESDALMALYLAEEITKEEWQAKKQEIKDALPYPEGCSGAELEQHCKNIGIL